MLLTWLFYPYFSELFLFSDGFLGEFSKK